MKKQEYRNIDFNIAAIKRPTGLNYLKILFESNYSNLKVRLSNYYIFTLKTQDTS